MKSGNIGGFEPERLAAMSAYINEHRTATTPFDIVVEGATPGDDRAKAAAQVKPLADAGATWWLEAMWTAPDNDLASLLKRIRQGPPRIE